MFVEKTFEFANQNRILKDVFFFAVEGGSAGACLIIILPIWELPL